MAVGKITVKSVRPAPVRNRPVKPQVPVQQPPTVPQRPPVPVQPPVVPEIRPVQVPAFVGANASGRLSVYIAAPTAVQAKDFVCSLYYNFVSFIQGSNLSLYTKDSNTLTMLTQTKQNLEYIASRPVGTNVKYHAENPENYTYVLTLSQAANQSLSTDIFFTCCSYSQIGSMNPGNPVFVLVNRSQGGAATESLGAVCGGRRINWVITGFEREKIYYTEEPDSPPNERLRQKMKAELGVPVKPGDTVSYAQVYGGLVVDFQENGAPVYTTVQVCREYQPVGCGMLFASFLLEMKNSIASAGGALPMMCSMLEYAVSGKEAINAAWREVYPKSEEQGNE